MRNHYPTNMDADTMQNVVDDAKATIKQMQNNGYNHQEVIMFCEMVKAWSDARETEKLIKQFLADEMSQVPKRITF